MTRRQKWTAPCVHLVRLGVILGLIGAIPTESLSTFSEDQATPPWDELGDFLPEGQYRFGDRVNERGMWPVFLTDGQVAGFVARTLPAARDVRGYSGPTEAIVWLDEELRVQRVGLLQSADTTEHVDAVRADREFLDQFQGWSWTEMPDASQVDAVSGATLTSLALAEGLLRRMGGKRTSLLFADPITVSEISNWFPSAVEVKSEDALSSVLDDQGRPIGQVLRTGPLTDDVMGYQGASELLLQLNSDGIVVAAKLRESQDNVPYTDYVRQENYFWKTFLDKSLDQLAEMDIDAEGIEGVSGATMTSLAVVETVVKAASVKISEDAAKELQNRSWWQRIRYGWTDLATWVLLGMAVWLQWFGWRNQQYVRMIWLVSVLLILGLWTGNLISLSLLAGWSTGGIAWQLAPGLATLVVFAIVLPPLRKTNPYCSHLCPHGAIQQLIRPGRDSVRKRSLGRRGHAWMRWLPGATLTAAYIALLMFPKVNLSDWEPFHAYLFQIAGWTSIGLAVFTLLISAFIPMGYCRYGCPTGSLLDYLRRTSRSDRVTLGDGVAVLLLIMAWMVRP